MSCFSDDIKLVTEEIWNFASEVSSNQTSRNTQAFSQLTLTGISLERSQVLYHIARITISRKHDRVHGLLRLPTKTHDLLGLDDLHRVASSTPKNIAAYEAASSNEVDFLVLFQVTLSSNQASLLLFFIHGSPCVGQKNKITSRPSA